MSEAFWTLRTLLHNICLVSTFFFIDQSFFSLSSLKLECDKLASEKSEMQRHYIMVSLHRTPSPPEGRALG